MRVGNGHDLLCETGEVQAEMLIFLLPHPEEGRGGRLRLGASEEVCLELSCELVKRVDRGERQPSGVVELAPVSPWGVERHVPIFKQREWKRRLRGSSRGWLAFWMRVSPTPSRRQSFLCRYSQPLLFESLPGEAFILVCRQLIVPFPSVFTTFSVGMFNAAGTADGSLHSGWACRIFLNLEEAAPHSYLFSPRVTLPPFGSSRFPQTLASACTGDPTMALSIGFLPAFTIGDGASGAALPRRAVLLPSFAPPRRWAVAAASRAAVEAAPDATGKRRPRGITKPRPVSPELQAVVGEAEIPRTQALKKIWAYIKENNLQVLFFILHL
ncbi:hypothetical protein B296_00026526 [Ensete ventricosum]|uniref:SWIB domain-containing protein n=1 Tax=Ensete ventricosum TaxID=4639 RepID=A0A426ZYN9_ENSVE|nr:hypothetical protein B296_00026526 [Ensete ventricosum]